MKRDQTMETTTVPMRKFEVQDDTGRRYNVTRYVWMVNIAPEGEATKVWRETGELFMTDNGDFLRVLPDGRFEVEGTGTLVRSVRSEASGSH
jgi:hypothetical protein